MSESNVDEVSTNFGLRARRSESWSEHAQESMANEDFDSAFLFYWIAFNALYADEEMIGGEKNERDFQKEFIAKIHHLDKQDGDLYEFLWAEYSNSIRNLLDNKFIFGRYWRDIKEHPEDSDWAKEMHYASQSALRALRNEGSVGKLLNIVFDRLHVLRNQLAHGSSTYGGSVNREQVTTGATFMHKIVPIIQQIFRKHPDEDWGVPLYPPQES